jgi:hypothetical protein
LSIERIKINGTEILTKDANGTQTFWTGNKYVKSDVNATFTAGGNQRTAMIVGSVFETGAQNYIHDNSTGGAGNFLVYPYTGGAPFDSYYARPLPDNIGRYLTLAIPSFDTFWWWSANPGIAAWDAEASFSVGGNYLFSAPTNYLYNGNISQGTYRLRVYYPFVDYGKSGGWEWLGYTIGEFNPTPLEKAVGGIFTFDRQLQVFDRTTGAARNPVAEWVAVYGYTAPVNWDLVTAIFASKAPVSLNLGITA